MRTPTPRAELYDWHSRALRGEKPVIDDTPQCGFFKRKLVRGGVFVPAQIWMWQDIDPETGELLSDEELQCEVNGVRADPFDAWTWICGNPITEAEYRYLEARIQHAARFEPDDAFADPRKPIDLNKTPLHF